MVLKVSGTWLVKGSPEAIVKQGQILGSGAEIQARSPKSRDSLTIILRDGSSVVRNCPEKCEPVLLPSSAPQQPSFFADLMGALSTLIGRNSGRYTTGTFSREATGPRDSVLLLQGGTADFTPALSGMASERYELKLLPVGSSTVVATLPLYLGATGKVIPVPSRDPQKAALQPGLYEARMERQGYSIWVLLAEQKDYVRLQKAFSEAVQLTDTWAGVADESRQIFLRAELDYLASEAKGIGQ
jgi:hypothetical protein